MLEPTPGDPRPVAGQTPKGAANSISFEDFTTSTLRAVRKALDTEPGGPRTFCDPEIILGIVIRPPRDIPDLGTVNTTSAS